MKHTEDVYKHRNKSKVRKKLHYHRKYIYFFLICFELEYFIQNIISFPNCETLLFLMFHILKLNLDSFYKEDPYKI